VPVRIAKPENLVGMVDKLDSPAYSTSVGLLSWAVHYGVIHSAGSTKRSKTSMAPIQGGGTSMDKFKSFMRRLLP
jgi:cell division protein FtsA